MTNTVATMTTNINVTIIENLFAPSGVIEFPETTSAISGLAGIRFEIHADANESRGAVRRHCFGVAFQQLRVVWPQLTLWLFACHSTWQPKNKRSLYLGLWKSLEIASVMLPTGDRLGEIQVESRDGVRFFGLVRMLAEETERAYDVLDLEPRSFIVGSTTGYAPVLDDLLLKRWQYYRPELAWWAELANVVCSNGCLLFRPFGAFDDVEIGLDVILETRILWQWSADMK